jgi:hypothetical protein
MGKKKENPTDAIRKANGKIGELLVAAELLRNGFQVSWPLIDKGYDLISDSQVGSIKRIQVKTARPNKYGTYDVSFSHGFNSKYKYTPDDIDAFAVCLRYDFQTAIYIIPIEAANCFKGVFWPPGQHPRHPEKWKNCKWEDYLYRWDLLR